MNAQVNSTNGHPDQLKLDALFKQGRDHLQRDRKADGDRDRKEQNDRKKRLDAIDAGMRKVIPSELHPYLKPYKGRAMLTDGMGETREVCIPQKETILIHLIFTANKWELCSGRKIDNREFAYQVFQKNAVCSMEKYHGMDLPLALALAEEAYADEHPQKAAAATDKPEQTYEPLDQEASGDLLASIGPSPFSKEQDLYIRNLILATCNTYFGS